MAIVWPAFALVALTLVVVMRLARLRFAAVRAGQVDPRFYKEYDEGHYGGELAVDTANVIQLVEAVPALLPWSACRPPATRR